MQQLSDERRLIKEAAREFTMNRVLPLANKLDPEKGLIPRELIDEMAELGYFAILIPEQYGGLGLGAYEYCLVAEELARGWMTSPPQDSKPPAPCFTPSARRSTAACAATPRRRWPSCSPAKCPRW